ncbi:hypothetical protein M3O96_19710 [Aquiflexum sp. TKW24L]|uniref:hypothetical protein n=1 Tax=Aquiflexum sp. TKW24L TaxID=2942212 RepID=UPI0020BF6D0D|nr:hypothetical protein [Aquiflexum sp. TKW24L]MCL6261336.1 hypothetical protein [Aquiflexum sp. TKW24L]
MKILHLRRFVTEIPWNPPFYPRAAVHGDLFEYENWSSTLHGVNNIQPTSGLLVEGGEMRGVSNHFGIEDSPT